MKKVLFVVCMMVTMYLFASITYADNASVTIISDKDKIDVNEEVEVSIDVESDVDIYEFYASISYDAEVLKFVGKKEKITGGDGYLKLKDENKSGGKLRNYTLKFKGIKKGITKIDMGDKFEILDEDGKKINASYIPTYIEIADNGEKDKDATLKSLKVSPGKLNKDFDSDRTSYKITVDNDIKELVINAETKSDKANFKIIDAEDLKVGENKVTIKVEAEAGNTKEYVITVKRLSEEEQEEKEAEKEEEKRKNRKVIYKDGKTVFITNDCKYEILNIVETDELKKPVGYEKIELNLYGVKIEALQLEGVKDSDVILIYAKNSDSGYEGYYRYDRVEKTIQRYFGETNSIVKDKVEEAFERQEYNDTVRLLAVVIGVLSMIMVVVVIIALKFFFDIRKIKNDNYLI